MEQEKPEPKIIGQGTYGCIFYPGINCKGKTEIDPKFISKLQSSKETTTNELEISRKVQTIPNYIENFAPIIENCPIKIGEIETKEINKCDVIEDTNFDINKVNYVGRDTLSQYLFKMIKFYPHKFLEIFIETHQILLDSLKKLNDAGIVHNDIKENNIMCRELDGRPIIIDFGLSIDIDFMQLPSSEQPAMSSILSKLNTYFFKYDSSYEVWSIEIIILNYMLDVLNINWRRTNITQEQITEIISKLDQKNENAISSQLQTFINKPWIDVIRYANDNNNLTNIIYELYGYNWRTQKIKREEITNIINDYVNNLSKKSFTINETEKISAYKNKLLEYLLPFENQTWENLLIELIKYKESWDNYALSIVYLKLINILILDKSVQSPIPEDANEQIGQYKELLLNNIFSIPKDRKKPEELKKELKQVLKTIPKKIMKNIFTSILNKIQNSQNILLDIARDKKETYRKEKEIYSAKL